MLSTLKFSRTQTAEVRVEHPDDWTEAQVRAAATARVIDVAERVSWWDSKTRAKIEEILVGQDDAEPEDEHGCCVPSSHREPVEFTDDDLADGEAMEAGEGALPVDLCRAAADNCITACETATRRCASECEAALRGAPEKAIAATAQACARATAAVSAATSRLAETLAASVADCDADAVKACTDAASAAASACTSACEAMTAACTDAAAAKDDAAPRVACEACAATCKTALDSAAATCAEACEECDHCLTLLEDTLDAAE